MKTTFKKALVEKTKDLGLSNKAIDDLVNLGLNGLDDDASEDAISEKVDSLIPFAKAMQGEVTRKTQKASKKTSKKSQDNDDDDNDDNDDDEKIPSWAKVLQDSVESLKAENAALKAEKSAAERKQLIASEAKKLGINDVFLKRLSIGDDEDVVKALTEYKQDLVNASLMTKDHGYEIGKTSLEEMTKAEEAFVNSLPSKSGSN